MNKFDEEDVDEDDEDDEDENKGERTLLPLYQAT